MSARLDNELAEAAARHLNGAAYRISGPVSVRDNSIVYSALPDDPAMQRMAIKCCRVSGGKVADVTMAKTQFESLDRIHRAFASADGRYGVPAALFFDPALSAYAMTWIDGESLTERMARWRDRRSLDRAFEHAGAWLGTFHRRGPLRQGLPDMSVAIGHLRGFIDQPSNWPPGVATFRRGVRDLLSDCDELAKLPVQVSWLHGDCKTDNLMVTANGMCGIDISATYENLIEHDLAQFLNNVEMLLSSMGFIHLKGMRVTLREAFLSGYRSAGPAISMAHLHWQRLWGATNYWHTRVIVESPSWPRRQALNHAFESLVRRLLGERHR